MRAVDAAIALAPGDPDIQVRRAGDPECPRAGALLVDMRPSTDFEHGHIPGTANLSLPVALSREGLGKLVGPNDPVIFSCFEKYCPYSAYASAKARLSGHTRVYRFASGFPGWAAAGYPVDTGAGSIGARVAAH